MQNEELEPGQGAEPSVASISRQVPRYSRSRECAVGRASHMIKEGAA